MPTPLSSPWNNALLLVELMERLQAAGYEVEISDFYVRAYRFNEDADLDELKQIAREVIGEVAPALSERLHIALAYKQGHRAGLFLFRPSAT